MRKTTINSDLTVAETIIFQQLNIKNKTVCDKRLAQQKIYLLQLLGNDLGYTFTWSSQDVYSDWLVHVLDTTHEAAIKTNFSSRQLTLHMKTSVNKVKIITDVCCPYDLPKTIWQSILVSIAHVYHNPIRWQTEPTKNDILDKLKKEFGYLIVLEYAWECLVRYGFISNRPKKTKRLTKKIR